MTGIHEPPRGHEADAKGSGARRSAVFKERRIVSASIRERLIHQDGTQATPLTLAGCPEESEEVKALRLLLQCVCLYRCVLRASAFFFL